MLPLPRKWGTDVPANASSSAVTVTDLEKAQQSALLPFQMDRFPAKRRAVAVQ